MAGAHSSTLKGAEPLIITTVRRGPDKTDYYCQKGTWLGQTSDQVISPKSNEGFSLTSINRSDRSGRSSWDVGLTSELVLMPLRPHDRLSHLVSTWPGWASLLVEPG